MYFVQRSLPSEFLMLYMYLEDTQGSIARTQLHSRPRFSIVVLPTLFKAVEWSAHRPPLLSSPRLSSLPSFRPQSSLPQSPPTNRRHAAVLRIISHESRRTKREALLTRFSLTFIVASLQFPEKIIREGGCCDF